MASEKSTLWFGIYGLLDQLAKRIKMIKKGLGEAPEASAELYLRLDSVSIAFDRIQTQLYGHQIKQKMSEFTVPGIADRIYTASAALDTRIGATKTQRESLNLGLKGLTEVESQLDSSLLSPLAEIEQILKKANCPWTPGQTVGVP